MSSYTAKTFHPDTGLLEDARWLDDYYGRHQYGVEFADGEVYRPQDCEQVGPKAMAYIKKLEAALPLSNIKQFESVD